MILIKQACCLSVKMRVNTFLPRDPAHHKLFLEALDVIYTYYYFKMPTLKVLDTRVMNRVIPGRTYPVFHDLRCCI